MSVTNQINSVNGSNNTVGNIYVGAIKGSNNTISYGNNTSPLQSLSVSNGVLSSIDDHFVKLDEYKINITNMNKSVFYLYKVQLETKYGEEYIEKNKLSFEDFLKYIIKLENEFDNDANIIHIKADQYKTINNTVLIDAATLEFELPKEIDKDTPYSYTRSKIIKHSFIDSITIFYDIKTDSFYVLILDKDNFRLELKKFYLTVGLNIKETGDYIE